jgi:hypothetical protein
MANQSKIADGLASRRHLLLGVAAAAVAVAAAGVPAAAQRVSGRSP